MNAVFSWKLRPVAGAVLLSAIFSCVGMAEIVPIVNQSFEILPAGGLSLGCGGACAYSQGVAIPGWTTTGSDFGQWIIGGYHGNPGATNGTVIAFSNGGTISQDVGNAVAGVTYTLSVDLLHRNDAAFEGTMALLVDGLPVAGILTGSDPGPGFWGTYTETYTALGGDDSKMLTIRLNSSGIQGDYDNVQLDATPEPGTMLLVASALTGFGLLHRKRKN
jgi:hypothetical protein